MWYNPIITRLLRSPLHGLAGANMMLITFSGRASGRLYTIPVSYVRAGDVLSVISYRRRTWWRNLRGGAPVALRLQGQAVTANASVIEDQADVSACLLAYLGQVPHYARFFKVSLGPAGQPDPADVRRAAVNRVMIQVQLAR